MSTSPRSGHIVAWKFILVGLAAGIMGGGLGVGGGIVLVPLLIYVGLDRHRAHATSLAAIVLISTVGAMSFAASGEIDLALGITIGVGGIVGSVLGANTMNRMSPRALSVIFGFVLLVAGFRMLAGGDPLPGSADMSQLTQTLIALGVGLVGGFFAGLAGIGGGLVNVPAGVFFLGMDQHEAQGTSLLAIVMTALAGTVANYRNERLVIREGLIAGAGGAVGSLIGSQLALGASEDTLALILGVLVIFVALRTFYQVARPRQPV
ncbi:MAG TPA: sulfite exporter TauE/SafE family protein [Acidimicrobiia bacterium]